MRGPLLSGRLGSSSTLEAICRWFEGARTAVVIGPMWLGEVLSRRMRILLLAESAERPRARRAVRRAAAAGHRLSVATAGVDLPIALHAVDALVVESASTLDAEALSRWMATLVPVVRPGGRVIAVDATEDVAVEARLAGLFLAAALTGITQERPRTGVVLTVGQLPPAPITTLRFATEGGTAYSSTMKG